MTEQQFSLRAQADEIKLRGSEQVDYLDKLRAKGKPKELLDLMGIRIEILREVYATLDRLAREEEAAARPPPAEAAPAPEITTPEVDEWGDPI